MLQPCSRNVGLAGFWNGTSEDHGNQDGLLTLGGQRCKDTASGQAVAIGLWRLLRMIIGCGQNRILCFSRCTLVDRVKVKSKPGRRVAGPFWAQAVNRKRQYLQIRIYKSLHFRQCRSCRKSQKVPTMFFCPVRIPSNARVVCSDRRL